MQTRLQPRSLVATTVLLIAAAVTLADDSATEDRAWWSNAQSWIRESEYHFSQGESYGSLTNREQGLRLKLSADRVSIGPRQPTEAAPWRVDIEASHPRAGPQPDEIRWGGTSGVVRLVNQPTGVRLSAGAAGGEPSTVTFLVGDGLELRIAEDEASARFYAGGQVVLQVETDGSQTRLRRSERGLVASFGTDSGRRSLVLFGKGGASGQRGLPDNPDWVAESDRIDADFGFAVATAGDYNGDGYSDVIVGAPFFDGGFENEGRVFLFRGGAKGLEQRPAWTADGRQQGAMFGFSVNTAGDVNDDGYADLVVGAPFHRANPANPTPPEGRAYLYLGNDPRPIGTPWIEQGSQPGANLGIAVSSAGDIDRDGFDDVLFGADSFDVDGLSNAGAAFAFCGNPSGRNLDPCWAAVGDESNSEFGQALAGAGDVNADGYADFVVGAPTHGSTDVGRVTLYLGSARALLSPIARWTIFGEPAFKEFGTSLSTAGDFDGDGRSDLIVGAPGTSSSRGKIYVFGGTRRGGLTAAPIWTRDGDQEGLTASARFGVAVSTAGDVNGDGFADVIVGAHRASSTSSQQGRVFLYLGGPGATTGAAAWSDRGEHADALFGRAVATAGDVNGDGFSDVIVGAPGFTNGQDDEGGAFVYHGRPLLPSTTQTWIGGSASRIGFSVATAGDVDGDGYSDIIAGAPATPNTAELWLGSAGGPVQRTWAPTDPALETNSQFGQAVSTAGDVNGDGYTDVIVGALRHGPADEGAVFVFRGSPSGLDDDASWRFIGRVADADLGRAVADAGDVNGDGFGDVIVGAPGFDVDGVEPRSDGMAYVFLGSADGLELEPSWTIASTLGGGALGDAVGSAGDVNGDGFDDVVIGAPGSSNDRGIALVFLGSTTGLSRAPAWQASGETAKGRFGAAVASAGDVNGDGFSDILVGAPTAPGAAFLFLGSPGGPRVSAAWKVTAEVSGSQLGGAVAGAGDVDGDGLSDVVISDGSREYVALIYRGRPGGLEPQSFWRVQLDRFFARSVATAGDVNGDGVSDVVISDDRRDRFLVYAGNGGGVPRLTRQLRTNPLIAPIALRGRSDAEDGFRIRAIGRSAAGPTPLHAQVQVAPTNAADATLEFTFPASNESSPQAVTILDASIDGLDSATLHRWRIRFASDDPLFPLTPWRSVPWNAVTEGKLRTAGELRPADFALIGPLPNEPVFPDSKPLTFTWNRGPFERFRLEWSSNEDFVSRVETSDSIDATASGDVQAFVPGVAIRRSSDPGLWQRILRLGRNPDVRSIPIFWRVVPLDGTPSNAVGIGAIRMQPPAEPVLAAPPNGVEFTVVEEPPIFRWTANHNRRYRIVFATTPDLIAPLVTSGDRHSISATSFTPSREVWDAVIGISARSAGEVYWVVFALDSLDRLTWSRLGNFRIAQEFPPQSKTRLPD